MVFDWLSIGRCDQLMADTNQSVECNKPTKGDNEHWKQSNQQQILKKKNKKKQKKTTKNSTQTRIKCKFFPKEKPNK